MAIKKARKPALGSVSWGTLRSEDLLQSFADALAAYAPRGNSKLIREARETAEALANTDDADTHENAGWIIEEIRGKLDEIAPEYVFFGAHDGDGADFGFWPCHDIIEELPEFGDFQDVRREGHFGDFRIGDTAVYRRHDNGRIVPLLLLDGSRPMKPTKTQRWPGQFGIG